MCILFFVIMIRKIKNVVMDMFFEVIVLLFVSLGINMLFYYFFSILLIFIFEICNDAVN